MSSERDVLQRLIAGPVSGDVLAREAGLTRAAMWKRIEALRDAGVDIDAQSGRGYALRHPVELLDAGAINAIVVMTDGQENESRRGLAEIQALLAEAE